jgi:hypothetical protein
MSRKDELGGYFAPGGNGGPSREDILDGEHVGVRPPRTEKKDVPAGLFRKNVDAGFDFFPQAHGPPDDSMEFRSSKLSMDKLLEKRYT